MSSSPIKAWNWYALYILYLNFIYHPAMPWKALKDKKGKGEPPQLDDDTKIVLSGSKEQ